MPADETLTTTIPLDGAVNARDVGGLPTADGGRIARGVLLRSDNLQDLTERDVATLVEEHGVRRVVDLRTEFELHGEGDGPLVAEPRVRIDHRSLYPATGGGTDLDLETVIPWGDGRGADLPDETPTVRAYLGYLERRPDSFVGAMRAIAEPEGATLVHCAAGKDRTGVVVALALAVAGVPTREIADDYLATGEVIVEIFARLAATRTYGNEVKRWEAHEHKPQPGAMERILELLEERHGGARGYLLSAGMTDDELDALAARLRD